MQLDQLKACWHGAGITAQSDQCSGAVKLMASCSPSQVTQARVVTSHLNFGSSRVIWSHFRVRVESVESHTNFNGNESRNTARVTGKW